METFEFQIMPKITGFGAAIVIVGAMFKIMHWPGAAVMLVAGLSTEAVIFALSAFLPPHKDPQWSRVYPQLADDFDGEIEVANGAAKDNGKGLTAKLDDMMSKANINQDVIGRIGSGLNNLATSVHDLKDLTNTAVATNEYTENVKVAAKSLVEMNKSYSKTVEAMAEMSNATQDAKAYHSQVQNITKNLGALNAVYEMELQDANTHLKAMNKFYSNLSSAMESMSEASKDTQVLREEVGRLAKNLATLNNVYGNMLTAMKG